MPLRLRLIALIGLVLLASLACGSVLVGWRAAGSVRTELRAALDVGTKTIRNGLDELAGADDHARELRHLVATFNGNRHVRAILLDGRDQPVAASELLVPAAPAPRWFRRLIDGRPDAVRIAVPPAGEGEIGGGEGGGGGTIVLQPDPTNEIAEVWADSRDSVLVLAGFALSAALLTCLVVGRALRPLDDLASAFAQIGTGDYHARMPAEHGPSELTRLADGFNVMTGRLAAAAAQNRRLNEQLRTLQEEERADLARDLHDEIGPLLFAVDMTAATIDLLSRGDRARDIPPHVRSIHESVSRMQRHVRTILEHLRPITAIGLQTAIGRLAAFWQNRRPDIAFVVDMAIEEDRIGDDLKETIYRVVQEGISNAIRHGKPTRVEIAIAHDGGDGIGVEVIDDGIGMSGDGPGARPDGTAERGPARLGLIGMRERVMAMAGSLSIRDGRDGQGFTLAAWLPCPHRLGVPQ